MSTRLNYQPFEHATIESELGQLDAVDAYFTRKDADLIAWLENRRRILKRRLQLQNAYHKETLLPNGE